MLHNHTLEELAQIQEALARQVIVPKQHEAYQLQKHELIASFDVQYTPTKAYIAADIQEWQGKHIGTFISTETAIAPYHSGYFAFREGPLVIACLQKVIQHLQKSPQLLIIDGHGLAHPRGFGLACYVGVKTNIPTIGVAKQALLRFNGTLPTTRGQVLTISHKQQCVGVALCMQNKVKPLYISVGHRIALSTAINICLQLAPNYRQLEPLRRADQAVRLAAKGQKKAGMYLLT